MHFSTKRTIFVIKIADYDISVEIYIFLINLKKEWAWLD